MREVSMPMVKPAAQQPRDNNTADGTTKSMRSTAFGNAMRSVMLGRAAAPPATNTPRDTAAPQAPAIADHIVRLHQRVTSNHDLASRVSATVDETLAQQAATKAATKAELEAEDRASQGDDNANSATPGIASVLARLMHGGDPMADSSITVTSAPTWVKAGPADVHATVSAAAASAADAAAALHTPTPQPVVAKPVVVETPEEAAAHKPPVLAWADRLKQTRSTAALETLTSSQATEPGSPSSDAFNLGSFFSRPGMGTAAVDPLPAPDATSSTPAATTSPQPVPGASATAPTQNAAGAAHPATVGGPVPDAGPLQGVADGDEGLVITRSPFTNGMSRPWRTAPAANTTPTEPLPVITPAAPSAPGATAAPAAPGTTSTPGATVGSASGTSPAPTWLATNPFGVGRSLDVPEQNAGAAPAAASAGPSATGQQVSAPWSPPAVPQTPGAAQAPVTPQVSGSSLTSPTVTSQADATTAPPWSTPPTGTPTEQAQPPVTNTSVTGGTSAWSFMLGATSQAGTGEAEDASVLTEPTVTESPAPTPQAVGSPHTAAPRPVASTAPTAPAAPPTPVPVPHQIVSAVGPLLSGPDGSYQLQLNLDPGELGPVRLTVDLRGGEVSIVMQASNSDTGDLLRENLDNLRQQLQQQGISAGNVDVGTGSGQQGFAHTFQHNPFAPRTGALPIVQPTHEDLPLTTTSPSTSTHDLDVSM